VDLLLLQHDVGPGLLQRSADPTSKAADPAIGVVDPMSGATDLASGCGGAWMGSASPWMGSLSLSTGFPFFVFYLIFRGGHLNRLGKDRSTATFRPRQLRYSPRLICFVRLQKSLCSSVHSVSSLEVF
jgi:hypothetical protein